MLFVLRKGDLFHEIKDEFLVLAFDLDASIEGYAHLFELCLCALELTFQHFILGHDFSVLFFHALIASVYVF